MVSGTLSLSGKKREGKMGVPCGWAFPIAKHNGEPVVLWKGYLMPFLPPGRETPRLQLEPIGVLVAEPEKMTFWSQDWP
jgi:hypothetical protein